MFQNLYCTIAHRRAVALCWILAGVLIWCGGGSALALQNGTSPAAILASGPGLPMTGATAQAPRGGVPAVGQCAGLDHLSADTQVHVTQLDSRALLEITYPNASGRKLELEYGDEVYVQKFGADGRLRVSFVLTAPTNEFVLTMSEVAPITCRIDVPNFSKLYRVVLRWHDPVQLDLNVIEPGGRMGEIGHVSGGRPNSTLTQGIGLMDLVSAVPAAGATSEISYVVADAAAVPADSVFGFKVDYVTRGAQPDAPYCDNNPLATPQFDFITIRNGTVNSRKMSVSRAHCRETIPEARRLMPIR